MNSSRAIVNVIILISLLLCSGFSDSVIKNVTMPYSKIIKSNIIILSNSVWLKKAAAMKTKRWLRNGCTFYQTSDSSHNGSQWTQSWRDTVINDYNNMIITNMKTYAKKGWDLKNLSFVDSCVIRGGNVVAFISCDYSDGKVEHAEKYTFEYYDDSRCIVETDYEWSPQSLSWIPECKDSMIFNTEMVVTAADIISESEMIYEDFFSSTYSSDYSYENYKKTYSYQYDTLALKWNLDYYSEMLEPGRTDTSLILYSKSGIGTENEIEYMTTYFFRCGGYLYKYLSGNVTKERPSGETEYRNLSQVKYLLKENMFSSCLNLYSSETGKFENNPYYFFEFYFDSHGKDTLSVEWTASPFEMSDTVFTKRVRKYDAEGNNQEVVEMVRNSYEKYVNVSKKVQTFRVLDLLDRYDRHGASDQKIHVSMGSEKISVMAESLTKVTLYDGNGRIVARKKRDVPGQITFFIDSLGTMPSKVYFAEVDCQGKITNMRILARTVDR